MKKIAIITSLSDLSVAYSLTSCIYDQYTTIKKYGSDEFKVNVYCNNIFNSEHRKHLNNDWHFTFPCFETHQYQINEKPQDDFENQVKEIEKHYLEVAEKSDIIITHDIMFIDCYLHLNQAIRNVIDKLDNKLWIHWIHSGPSIRPENVIYPSILRYKAAPKSKYVFLNYSYQQDFANMILSNTSSVHVVHNTRDISKIYEFSTETKEFIDKYDVVDHDILQVYPFSIGRWRAKGVDRLTKIFSFWKEMNQKAKLILVNSHSNLDGQKPINLGIPFLNRNLNFRFLQ